MSIISKLLESGFSKDLKEVLYSGKLYHATTIEGAISIVNEIDTSKTVNCSTDNSITVISRPVVFVLDVKNKHGLYTSFDADAGKNFGYDEFRTNFSVDEFKKSIDNIYVTNDLMQSYKKNKFPDEYEGVYDWFDDYYRIIKTYTGYFKIKKNQNSKLKYK